MTGRGRFWAVRGRRRIWGLIAAVTAVAALFALLTGTASALPTCTDHFTGASGGNWNDGTNWDNGVPDSSTVACWTGKSVTVTDTESVDSIQGGDLDISGNGNLTLTNGSDDSQLGNLTIAGGTLNGPSPLTLSGNFSWTGGTIGGALPVTQTGGTFSISGSSQAYLVSGTFTTPSNVSISDTDFIATGASSLTTTGTVTFADGTYTSNGTPMPLTATSIITTANDVLPDYALHITGNGTSLGGSLTVPALTTDSGVTLTVSSTDILAVGSGTIDGTITGQGEYSQGTGTTTFASGAALTVHTVQIPSGTLSVDSGATYTAATSTTVSGSGALDLGPSTASTGDYTQSGESSLGGGGKLSVTGAFSWSGGEIGASNGAIAVTQTGTGTFQISGTDQAYLVSGSLSTPNDVSITNTDFIAINTASLTTTAGTVTFAPGSYTGNGTPMPITAKGFITNGDTSLPDYALHVTGASTSLGGSLTVPELDVPSPITITVPSGDTLTQATGTIGGTITGPGTYQQAGGTTTFASGAALTVDTVAVPTGTLSIDSGATYTAATSTTVSGSGTLDLGPSTASTGDYTQSDEANLGGSGKLTVSGAFAWSGGVIGANNGGITVTQTGNGTFSISGADQAYLLSGSLSTPNDVSISNTDFIGIETASLTSTAGTVTFAPGSYSGNGNPLPITAAGFDTSGDTSLPDYALHVTGNGTSLGGSLTVPELDVPSPITITVPAGDTLTQMTGTIGGTITGPGTYQQTNTTTTFSSGATLSTATVSVASGTLSVNAGATYTAATSTTVSGSGTLDVGPSTASTGDYTQSGEANLGGSGTLTVSGAFAWSGGVIGANNGGVTVKQTGTGTFSISGTAQAYLVSGSLTTPNDISITNTDFIGINTASLTSTTGTITFAPGTYSGNGTPIPLTAEGFKTSGDTTLPDYALHVTGTTTRLGGSLTVPELDVPSPITITVPTGDTLTQANGTIGGTITGPGTYQQGNGTTTFGSGAALTVDTVAVPAGTLSIDGGATYTAATSTTVSGSGTLDVGPSTASTGDYTESGEANLGGSGTLTVSGAISWSGGVIGASNGGITVKQTGTGTFQISGTDQAYLVSGTLSTPNDVSITNLHLIGIPPAGVTSAGTVTFAAGDYQSNGTPIPITANGFVTSGDTTLPDYALVQTGGTTTVPGGRTVGGGPVSIQGGTFDVDGTLSATPTAVTGGTLTGAGTVQGSVANTGGTVAPATGGTSTGMLTIGGSYSQDSSSTLSVMADSATTYSRLAVNGDVSLQGTLNLKPSAAYAAAANPGDALSVLTFSGTRSGTFDTVTSAPPLNSSETFSADYSAASNVSAVVGAASLPQNTEPPTISDSTPAVGTLLTCSPGTWTNDPRAYDFTWNRDGTAIAGAADATYTVTSDDQGHTLTCTVVAGNPAGRSQPATSAGASVPAASGGGSPPPTSGGGGGTTTSTTPGQPTVQAGAPVVVTNASDAFSATVDPSGQSTTAHFEYGLDPKYFGGGTVTYAQDTPSQTVGSDFADHTVTDSVSGLVPNAVYHVRLVATNASGATTGPDETFTTAATPPPPAPTLAQTANVTPVSGFVLIKPPPGKSVHAVGALRPWAVASKGQGFIPLTQARQIPVGSQIDARRGTLQLVDATGQARHTQAVRLTGGLFTTGQTRGGVSKGLTTFTLNSGGFSGAPTYASCPKVGKVAHTAAAGPGASSRAQAAKLSSKILQTLHAVDNHGKFRTKGRYSAGTVRGTDFTTTERCDGTLTAVHKGIVDVLDFRLRTTIAVHAGQSYLASAGASAKRRHK